MRVECVEKHEDFFAASGFRRLVTQEALRCHTTAGDPKRLVVMERMFSRWDEARPLLLLEALAASGRATPKPASALGGSPPLVLIQRVIALSAAGSGGLGEFWPDFLRNTLLMVYF